MCGISGIINNSGRNLNESLKLMRASLHHRGPDFSDSWVSETANIGLAHNRLSILDLSESGNQPMFSSSKRYVIVFNGEIYNYQTLKKALEKEATINWRGTSDTEILLACIEAWGVQATLSKLVGMYAFAIFDTHKNKLVMARDRMGEKPLYYGFVKSDFVFASELSAIAKIPGFDNPILTNSIGLYLQYSSIPEPYSIYENIYKLNSGHMLVYNLNTRELNTEPYWQFETAVQQPKLHFESDEQAITHLNTLLNEAIGLEMHADVPIGAFLSGGIDSSTVAAIMQSLNSQKINTFSIGFNEKGFNEAEYAKAVAKHIGSNHHELYIGAKELLEVVPSISSIFSEPFSEASQIPTYLVSKMAKQKVTVALSGDAGDELFCGYFRYHATNAVWNQLRRFPLPMRKMASNIFQKLPYEFWKLALYPLSLKKGPHGITLNYPDKFLKFFPLLKYPTRREFYHRGIMTHNREIESFISNFKEPPTVFTNANLSFKSAYEEMMYLDTKTYLINNNLTKADRTAMAVSLETRVPLLDHRIVEFAARLPLHYKYRDKTDKWILKNVLYRYVPESFFNRPKQGFSVPLSQWLKTSLKDWAESLISEKKLKEYGFFNPTTVRTYWNEHQSGKRNWSGALWDVLIFHDWFEKQKAL